MGRSGNQYILSCRVPNLVFFDNSSFVMGSSGLIFRHEDNAGMARHLVCFASSFD